MRTIPPVCERTGETFATSARDLAARAASPVDPASVGASEGPRDARGRSGPGRGAHSPSRDGAVPPDAS